MARLTKDEAKMRAASLVLGLVTTAGDGWKEFEAGDDCPAIEAEMRLIAAWLRDRACGGDAVLRRQLGKETGRQAKPAGKMAKQIERLAKKAGLDRP